MRLVTLLWLLLSLTHSAWSAFDSERPGVRAAGLAGAFTALADNADALHYNPAGLMTINQQILAANYANLLIGLDEGAVTENSLAYILPIPSNHAIGFMWTQKNILDIYQENTVNFGYSQTLDREQKIKAGLALDLLFINYNDQDALANNPIFSQSNSVVTLALDMGLMVAFSKFWSVGLGVSNLNQPNLSIVDDQANLPMQLRLGTAYRQQPLATAIDLLLTDNHYRVAMGGEYWWWDQQAATRLGVALGSGKLSEITLGASIVWRRELSAWHLDYTFILPLGEQQVLGSSHQVSLQLRFGSSEMDELEREGLRLKQLGQAALKQGNQFDALAMWEEAIEYLPNDDELATSILTLQDELEKESEFMAYKTQGLNDEKNNNLINAQKALQKALELIPEDDEVNEALARINKKIKNLNQKQLAQSKAKVKKGVPKTKQVARINLTQANRLFDNKKSNKDLMRYFKSDIERLQETLEIAKSAYRRKDYATADAKSLAIITELERLQSRVAIKVRASQRARSQKKDQTQSSTKKNEKKTNQKEIQSQAAKRKKMRKQARGAYGRAIKLMIDIDQLRGATYYPNQYQRMKNTLVLIKSKLKQGNYLQTLRDAKRIFPELEALKKSCEKKEAARKAMPLNW